MVQAKINSIKNWVYAHKVEAFLLVLVLVLASFMRLYRIAEYMTFLGDEGRDVIIVRNFVKHGDIMLIGPGTSIGNMYLGPIYYYMMAPFLFLFNYSPVGPSVMVALFGVATVFFIWYCGKIWSGNKAAFIASLLYAISPVVINYSRSSWNPNIMPFFALLTIFSMWKVYFEKKDWWLIVASLALAVSLQSHYLGLLLAIPIVVFFVLSGVERFKQKKLKTFLLKTLFSIVAFFLLMSPLFVFDFRHNLMNFKAIQKFFTERQTTVSIKPWKALPSIFPQVSKISGRLLASGEVNVGKGFLVVLLLGALMAISAKKFKLENYEQKSLIFLLVWLISGVVGLSLYKQEIYDHYYGFIMPVFFLFGAMVLAKFWKIYPLRGGVLAVTILLALVWVNFINSPLKASPNRQLQRSMNVAKFIKERASGDIFNLAVIAERNYEGAYQYFLEEEGNFRIINPQNTSVTIGKYLFVVCEMEKSKCNPTNNPKTEVAAFGWSKIEDYWEVEGVNLFKLGHNYPVKDIKQK